MENKDNEEITYIGENTAKFIANIFINNYLNGNEKFKYNFSQSNWDRYELLIENVSESASKVFRMKFDFTPGGNYYLIRMSENSFDRIYNAFSEEGFDFLIPSKKDLEDEMQNS